MSEKNNTTIIWQIPKKNQITKRNKQGKSYIHNSRIMQNIKKPSHTKQINEKIIFHQNSTQYFFWKKSKFNDVCPTANIVIMSVL